MKGWQILAVILGGLWLLGREKGEAVAERYPEDVPSLEPSAVPSRPASPAEAVAAGYIYDEATRSFVPPEAVLDAPPMGWDGAQLLQDGYGRWGYMAGTFPHEYMVYV